MREQALVRKVHQRRSSSKALPIERTCKKHKTYGKESWEKQIKKRNEVSGEVSFLILLVAGGLAKNIYDNRTNYTAEFFYQVSSRKLTHSIRVAFLTDVHLREYGMDNGDLVEGYRKSFTGPDPCLGETL